MAQLVISYMFKEAILIYLSVSPLPNYTFDIQMNKPTFELMGLLPVRSDTYIHIEWYAQLEGI